MFPLFPPSSLVSLHPISKGDPVAMGVDPRGTEDGIEGKVVVARREWDRGPVSILLPVIAINALSSFSFTWRGGLLGPDSLIGEIFSGIMQR